MNPDDVQKIEYFTEIEIGNTGDFYKLSDIGDNISLLPLVIFIGAFGLYFGAKLFTWILRSFSNFKF